MSSDATHEFPSPIGGVPLDIDFAPSILFAVLYGLLIPVAIYRVINPRSRNMVLIGTLIFVAEHSINFSLRAHAAHSPNFRNGKSFEAYLQATLAAGFISIGQDLLTLLRALLVSTTFGQQTAEDGGAAVTTADQAAKREDAERGASSEPLNPTLSAGDLEDQPRRRFWFRQGCGYAAILFLGAVILSIIAGVNYERTIGSGAHADLVRRLLYISAGVSVALLVLLIAGTLCAMATLSRLPARPPARIVVAALLLTAVGIYRLSILHNSTTSLTSTAPSSQNTTHSKVLFYVFHIAPEWLSAALLLSVNVRRTYKTGMWGDMNSEKPLPP
ncbi:hypothetical protein OH77DRAFT_1038013 [Trametes cingulata]|nr:hypothetical protein OH77DRAFT_1038013 [Trametes cingulata]